MPLPATLYRRQSNPWTALVIQDRYRESWGVNRERAAGLVTLCGIPRDGACLGFDISKSQQCCDSTHTEECNTYTFRSLVVTHTVCQTRPS